MVIRMLFCLYTNCLFSPYSLVGLRRRQKQQMLSLKISIVPQSHLTILNAFLRMKGAFQFIVFSELKRTEYYYCSIWQESSWGRNFVLLPSFMYIQRTVKVWEVLSNQNCFFLHFIMYLKFLNWQHSSNLTTGRRSYWKGGPSCQDNCMRMLLTAVENRFRKPKLFLNWHHLKPQTFVFNHLSCLLEKTANVLLLIEFFRATFWISCAEWYSFFS